jgi:poly(A) polymerase
MQSGCAALSARLKMSRTETGRLLAWAGAPAVAPTLAMTALDRLLYRHGEEPLVDRIRLSLASARSARRNRSRQPSPKPPGTAVILRARSIGNGRCFRSAGADLIARGIDTGTANGRTLSALEERWIDSNFTLDKQALLDATD